MLMLVLTLAAGLLSTGLVQAAPRDSAVMARGYAHERAVGVTTHFRPTDNPLHCVVHLQDLPAAATLRVVWIATQAGGVRNYVIARPTFALRAGEAVVDARLWLPRRWPVGAYQVDLLLNGRLTQVLPFRIS
jgi:hypothetical protein